MRTDGLKLETGETTEIDGKEYTKVTSDFLRPDNKKLYFYYDNQNEMFTDRCQVYFHVIGARAAFEVVEWVAARYHCQRGKLRELRSSDPVALIQAMLAVYAWCEMKEWLK
jgi:hypothetical protein